MNKTNRIIAINRVLVFLMEKDVLERDKKGLCFGDRLFLKNIMGYAQDIADNDNIWGMLPESWERPVSVSKEMPEGVMTLQRDALRKELRLLLAPCDDVSGV